jgi:acyl-CoA synthetase (NDP forming)
MMAASRSLDALLRPASVAVFGASNDPNKVGGRPIAFLLKAGYAGTIVPINPGSAQVQGLPAYASLAEAPPVEHAIIALAAPQAVEALAQCAAHGVKAVQVFSAGFAETGNADLQRGLVETAARAGIRLIGPNSLGLINLRHRFFGTFATALDGAWPRAGGIALATQSGAFGSYVYGLMEARGLRFSHFIATGNEADVDVAECIEWLAGEPEVEVIVATFEACRDGRRLLTALETARRAGKPVLVMKAGASEAGAQAAATHTGSLAGSDAVYDAALRQAGAWRAQSLDELADIAYLLSSGRLPAGNDLGVVTTSGGIGVLIADKASQTGLRLPPLPMEAQAAVKALLPFAGASNPLDTSAALIGDLSLFARTLDILLAATPCDTVLGYLAHVGRNPRHYAQLKGALFELRARHPEKLFVLCMLAPPEVREELEAHGCLLFEEPTRAVAAIAAAAWLGRALKRPVSHAAASAEPLTLPRGSLNEAQSKSVIAAAGVRCLPEHVARDARQAVAAAREMEGAVAMKILSADIAHKTEIGGVRLGIQGEQAVTAAFEEIVANAARQAPTARVEGVLVSPMLAGGVETVVGVTRDPVFGPVVMFGLGGIHVEVFKDVAFRIAPFGVEEARAMIADTRASALLAGVRGAPPCDTEDLARSLARLSAFAWAHADKIQAMDINPYVALPQGGYALDALVVPHEET